MSSELEKNYFEKMQDGQAPEPNVSGLLGGKITQVDLNAGTLESNYFAIESFLNPAGQVQGGMLSAMLDDVTAFLVTAILAPNQYCATLNLNVSFLRPAQLGLISGKSRLIRKGRDVCYVQGELLQGGKQVAVATATCMLVSVINSRKQIIGTSDSQP